MATERQVTKSGKNKDGDITSLCNNAEWWSPRSKADAIRDIEKGDYSYFVEEEAPRVFVKVVERSGTKHLQTVADKSSKNNLDNLPDC